MDTNIIVLAPEGLRGATKRFDDADSRSHSGPNKVAGVAASKASWPSHRDGVDKSERNSRTNGTDDICRGDIAVYHLGMGQMDAADLLDNPSCEMVATRSNVMPWDTPEETDVVSP